MRCEPSPTMGLKLSSVKCARGGRPCRGMLRDTILDWEDELPAFELDCAEKHCKSADLCVCLGTSLQIFPVADLPFMCRRRRTKTKGKVVIINLQATPASKKADMVIHAKTDLVMKMILERLDIQCPSYTTDKDLILLRNECTDHLIY